MRIIAAAAITAACLLAACSSDSSTFALTNASVDESYTCPVGTNNAPYDLQATVGAHNGTARIVTITSASADLTLQAIQGSWLEKVGDKYQASNVTVTPNSVASGANASLKVTIPSACTNGKATNGASSGDYRVTVHIATSAGNYSITSKTLHRLVAA
jgi:hypothetical protein